MENTLNVVKRDIFKGIVTLILLKKFAIVFFNFKSHSAINCIIFN